MNHILTAATQGMKAGYNQRKRTIQRGGLNVSVGSFSDYCAKFGPDVTAAQESMRNKPRNARVVGVRVEADEPIGLAEEILAARERLAALEATFEAESKPVRKPANRKAASKVKENRWNPWAVRKHNIPTKVGATFSYKGKRRTTTFKVTRVEDGVVFSKRVA